MQVARMGGRESRAASKTSNINATNRRATPARFSVESVAATTKNRTVSSYFAPYRAKQLTFNGNAQGTHISAAVK